MIFNSTNGCACGVPAACRYNSLTSLVSLGWSTGRRFRKKNCADALVRVLPLALPLVSGRVTNPDNVKVGVDVSAAACMLAFKEKPTKGECKE